MADTMKLKFKNTTAGPRGVHGVAGLVMIEAGKTVEVEVTEAEAKSADGTGYFEVGAGGGGESDGAPASLSGLNKKLLLEIAEAEGVDVEDGATNAAITAAIEAKRAGGAA